MIRLLRVLLFLVLVGWPVVAGLLFIASYRGYNYVMDNHPSVVNAFLHKIYGLFTPRERSGREMAALLQKKGAALMHPLFKGDVREATAHFSGNVLYMYLKVGEKGLSVLAWRKDRLQEEGAGKLRKGAAFLLCPYLEASRDVEHLEVTVTSDDPLDTVRVRLTRGVCVDMGPQNRPFEALALRFLGR